MLPWNEMFSQELIEVYFSTATRILLQDFLSVYLWSANFAG